MAHTRRVTQLAQRLRLDLADTFASDVIHLADLFERAFVAVNQTEAHLQNLAFAFGQRGEHVAQLLAQQTVAGHVRRIFRRLVLDEIADAHIAVVAELQTQAQVDRPERPVLAVRVIAPL